MSQVLADKLKEEFETITGVNCKTVFLKKGLSHKPTTLQDGQKGVYVFLNENYCFKVGKAGSKSKPRWNSHHYNLDETTRSTFPKSIVKDRARFKSFFPDEKHKEIDELEASSMRSWVQNNISRIEFIISSDESDAALNLLEALLQFRLEPEYEGKRA